jgi:hypothetical protein
MNDAEAKDLSRRRFLAAAAGVAGGALSKLAFGAAVPCPPPSVSVTAGTSATTSCGDPSALPSLVLTSGARSGTYGWTFGHAFRQGDVPAGQYITIGGAGSQAMVRNRWSDGSVKYAVLSAVSPFSQNVPKKFAISTTSKASSGNTVLEPTNLNVTVTFTGAVTGTYSVQSSLGVDLSRWNKEKAGRVRQILGPVMSEFHYYVPTSDAHVALWFYVRRYGNGTTEIETVVENGWLYVANPGERDYSIELNVGGSTAFSASLSHFSHSRWSRVDWIGVDPNITPRHDPAYLRSTRMVPNYGYTSPSSAAFVGLASALSPTPFALGNWTLPMGNAGYQRSIGIVPQWEALYCTTSDPRAYAATISNNRGSGRWPIHYRDETTGRVPNYLSYPSTTFTSNWGTQPPAPTGGTNGVWNIPHHPSNGYLAYLIEGRWTQLESLQFAAMDAIMESNPPTRQGGGVLACWNPPLTTRGAAWAWRTMAQVAAVNPRYFGDVVPAEADSALTNAWVQSIHDTTQWNNLNFIVGSLNDGTFKNTIGWLGQYDSENPTATDAWWGDDWMADFQSMALAHAAELAIEGLSNQADLESIRNFSYQSALQLMGDNSTWNFRHAACYERGSLAYGSNPKAPRFLSISQSYQIYLSHFNLPAASANKGDSLFQKQTDIDSTLSSSNTGFGYWATRISVIALAIDAGVDGATNAYALIQAAPNYQPQADGASDKPQFAFVPRT